MISGYANLDDVSSSPGSPFHSIGQPLLRREDQRLLTGRGQFSDDFALSGQAHAAMVRSLDKIQTGSQIIPAPSFRRKPESGIIDNQARRRGAGLASSEWIEARTMPSSSSVLVFW